MITQDWYYVLIVVLVIGYIIPPLIMYKFGNNKKKAEAKEAIDEYIITIILCALSAFAYFYIILPVLEFMDRIQ